MLPFALLRTGLRDLVRRPLHTGLMVLGVALGVAVVVAIDLANGAAQRGFARSTEAMVGRATHEIRGGPGGLPEDLYRRLRVENGVRPSAPVVEGVVMAMDLDRRPLRVLGVDALAERPFRSHFGEGTLSDPGFARFYTDEKAVLVGAALAERHGLAPGSPLRVQAGDRVVTLEVLGIVDAKGADARSALASLLILDVAAAQRLLHMEGKLSHIDVILAGEDEAEALRRALPPEARLARASEQADTVAQLTAAFELNLTALSLLALVVGMFLIYNTVTFSVVQRRAVFGILRSLGAVPQQLFGLILVETAVAAAVGVLLGLGLGYLLGQSAVRLVTRTINDLYYVVSVTQAPLTAATAAKGVLLGLGAALLAALAPALEAARVQPVAALRRSTLESRAKGLVPRLAAGGLATAVLGGVTLLLARHSLLLSFAGLFGVVLGLAMAAPAFTVVLMAGLRPLASRLVGPIGRLATGTVARAVSRTGLAAASLMVAVSVTIGVSVMIASFRSTVANWLDVTLQADLYISAPSPGGARSGTTIAADIPARVAAVPGVAEVETIRIVSVDSPDGEVQLGVSDATRSRSASIYRFAEGSPDEVWRRVREGAVLVSEPFAFRHRIPPRGGSVTLRTDRGPHTFPVAAIYYDYATERGTVLMSRGVYERHWDDRGRTSVAAYIAPGHEPAAVADAVRIALAGTTLNVVENRALRRGALAVFDRTFAVTEALRLLAVVVAFIGVWSALLALQVERTRELGTLQALGLLPGQLFGLTLLETGLIGLAAGLLSLPTGLLLAVILIRVINVRSFGWTMQLHVDPLVLAQAVTVSVIAALLAAIYPARRLQRMSVAASLRHE
jgi:putative ABC transport system permease protein